MGKQDVKFVISAVDRVSNAMRRIDASTSKTQKSLDRFARAGAVMKGVAAGVAAVGIAAATTTTAVAALTGAGLKNVDAIAKTSDKLGIATEELIGLHHAAELSGNSTKTLDTALQRMVRRVSEAAKGTGEAKDAIKELGFNAQQLAKQTPDEQFRQLADAMAEVDTQGDRVRLAMKLFDTEGVGLVNTLKGGSIALREATREAEELGKSFSRFDAARVEEANDNMARLRGITEGLSRQMAIELAPAIGDVAESLLEFNKSTGAVEKVATAIGDLTLGTLSLAAQFPILESAFEVTFKTFEAIILRTAQFAADKIALTQGVYKRFLNSIVVDTNEALRKVTQAFNLLPTISLPVLPKITEDDLFNVDEISVAQKMGKLFGDAAGEAEFSAFNAAKDLQMNRFKADLEQERLGRKFSRNDFGPSDGLLGGGDDDIPDLLRRIQEESEAATKGLDKVFTAGSRGDLTQKINDAREALDNLVPGTNAFERAAADLVRLEGDFAELEASIDGVRDSMTAVATPVVSNTIAGIREQLSRLHDEFENTRIGTERFRELRNEIERLEDQMHGSADVMAESMERFRDVGISAIDEFVETGRFSIRSFVADALQEFAKIQLRSAIGTVGGVLGGSSSSILSGIGGILASFDGGGSIPDGPRSGGIDGKGGFLGVLHPGEDVYDRKRGQSQGGGDTYQTINLQPGMSAEMIPQILEAAAQLAMNRQGDHGDRGGQRAQQLGFT